MTSKRMILDARQMTREEYRQECQLARQVRRIWVYAPGARSDNRQQWVSTADTLAHEYDMTRHEWLDTFAPRKPTSDIINFYHGEMKAHICANRPFDTPEETAQRWARVRQYVRGLYRMRLP